MTFVWLLHDIRVNCTTFMWASHEIRVSCTWHSCELQMTFVWLLHDVRVNCTWHSCDHHMTFVWTAHDIRVTIMTFVWTAHDLVYRQQTHPPWGGTLSVPLHQCWCVSSSCSLKWQLWPPTVYRGLCPFQCVPTNGHSWERLPPRWRSANCNTGRCSMQHRKMQHVWSALEHFSAVHHIIKLCTIVSHIHPHLWT